MKSFVRKSKKLYRDPKQFLYDSKILNPPKNVADNDTEPRVIGELDLEAEKILVVKDKKIQHKSFSTLFLIDTEIKSLNKVPILGELFKNENNFIGFREKVLFALRVKDTASVFSDVYEKLVHDKEWHSGAISSFKNIILVGRYIKYAEFFRASNVNCNIYAILSERESMIEQQEFNSIDHLICHKAHMKSCGFKKDVSFFRNTNELLKSIEQRVTQAGEKPYDYLVPVSGDIGYIQNIDELNEGAADICLKLSKTDENIVFKTNNFNSYIDSLANNVEFIMMRESLMQRYASLVSKLDVSTLLKNSIKDGARVKIL
ncbi:MAG: hypothetical protein RPS47_08925 [Colwellia sp.]|jgi:hypothetical protein